MGKKNGRMIYVPHLVIEELETIKKDDEIIIGSDAFRKMVGYSRIGREMEKIKDDPARLIKQPLGNLLSKKSKGWKYRDLKGNIKLRDIF